MKKIYFLLMMMLTSAAVWSQHTWVGLATGGNWNVAANWSRGTVPANGDTVLINGGVTGTITNVAAVGNILLRGLRIEGGSTVTFTNPTFIRTITIDDEFGSEDFYIEAGSVLTMGAGNAGVNITIHDDKWTEALIAGTLIVSPNRIYKTNNNETIGQKATRVTGTIDNRGSVLGNPLSLEFQDGGTYIHSQNGGTVPTATWTTASNCNITGVVATAPGGLGQPFGNLTWNSGNQTGDESLAASGMTITGTLSVMNTGSGQLGMSQTTLNVGNLTITDGTFRIGGAGFFSIADRILNVAGDVSISGGILLMSEQGLISTDKGTLNVTGNFTHNGGTITENNGAFTGEINFSGTTTQTFSKAPAAVISNTINFNINSGAKVDFGNSILNGSNGTFTLNAGGKIIVANDNGLRSSGAFGAVQIPTRVYNSVADYEFQGASTGNFGTSGNQVRDLIINNTGGQVTAARPFIVNGVLALANGYLTTNAGTNKVTVNTAGSATTANGAFVNGPLTKATNNITAFTFPVGKVDGGLRTIGVKPTSTAASNFTAQFFRAPAPAGTPVPALTRVSDCEYWDLARTGTAPATVTLSWAPASPCGPGGGYVTNLLDLRVAHLTGGTWLNEGNTAVTGNPTAGTVTSATVNTFSPFALASSSAANPLPVVFADVKAYEKNNGVQIEWSNLTEKDVAGYTVERSANGTDFSAIDQQLPTSNQNDKASYDAFDATPLQGSSFYRIKAEETTGKIVYSKILSVNLGNAAQGLRLYPNPVSGNQVTISLSNVKRGQYNLRVVNTAGQDIYKQLVNNQGSTMTQTIDLPASIKPGVYNMIITSGDYRGTKTFIVR